MGDVINIVPILKQRKKDEHVVNAINNMIEAAKKYHTPPTSLTRWGCGYCGEVFTRGEVDPIDHALMCTGWAV